MVGPERGFHNMTNADADEVANFEALATKWWDPNGPFRPLHDINGPRLDYIRARCELAGRTALDVGCGGGLLTEALAGQGAAATGIDAGEAPLGVARRHAEGRFEPPITYAQATAESFLASAPGTFDIVTCLETLEHIPDVPSAVRALAELTTPGGDVFLATINRTPKAFALAIVGAEHLLRILPKGTHRYENLIRPAELGAACRQAGLTVLDVAGMRYNPFTRRAGFDADVSVNYMLHARRS